MIQASCTYKIKPTEFDAAMYITVVDDEHGFPFHVFINSKHVPTFEWVEATKLTLNALLKQSSFPGDLLDEMCTISDPHGGYFHKGQRIPSVPAHIALILRKVCEEKGIMPAK